MYISELFDKKVKWEWETTNTDGDDFEASFSIDKILYRVTIDIMFREPEVPQHITNIYEVVFTASELDDMTQWDKTNITNSGNSLSVMATVLEILQDFFSKTPSGTTLIFTASESSRRKLYAAMSKRFATKGWEVFAGFGKNVIPVFSSYFLPDEYGYIITKP